MLAELRLTVYGSGGAVDFGDGEADEEEFSASELPEPGFVVVVVVDSQAVLDHVWEDVLSAFLNVELARICSDI